MSWMVASTSHVMVVGALAQLCLTMRTVVGRLILSSSCRNSKTLCVCFHHAHVLVRLLKQSNKLSTASLALFLAGAHSFLIARPPCGNVNESSTSR
jgi:hypothetical protein